MVKEIFQKKGTDNETLRTQRDISMGIIAWFVSTRSKDEAVNKSRKERGILIASGFIAGGALMGVISALLLYFGFNWVNHEWFESHSAEILGLVMFSGIVIYMIWDSMRAKKED